MIRSSLTIGGFHRRQRGVFAVEFALVAAVIGLFLVFISDVVIKQNIQGNLQRLSYSGVNIIKERTQLYNVDMDNDQFNELRNILISSITRTMGGFEDEMFGIYLEQVVLLDKEACKENTIADCYNVGYSHGKKGSKIKDRCQPATPLKDMHGLYFTTNLNTPPTFYQVTLCYQTADWFGNYVGVDYNGLVRVSSVMMGR